MKENKVKRKKRERHREKSQLGQRHCLHVHPHTSGPGRQFAEGTAAGLLGELLDGQGECCFANPQGREGGFNGINAIFIHPPFHPPLLVMTLLLNTEQQLV